MWASCVARCAGVSEEYCRPQSNGAYGDTTQEWKLNDYSEEELGELLRDDLEFGIQLLYTDFRYDLARRIKWYGRGFITDEDLQDVYQDTMIAFVEKLREGDFDYERPLRMLNTIAKNKAVDFRRRRGYRQSKEGGGLVDLLAEELKDTSVGWHWQTMMGATERGHFMKAVLEIIDGLPERQRMVALAFVDNYEDFQVRNTYQPLAEAVGSRTGKVESVAAVKSAWHQARKKIAEELVDRGYDFLEGMES